MKVVGLIGGIASGKSRAAEALVARGAVWIDADKLGHEVFDEPEVKAALRERFGSGVFTNDGRIDRKALSKLVFPPAQSATTEAHDEVHPPAYYNDNRAWLERLLHPLIRELASERLDAAKKAGAPLAVLDAPLMLETGWSRLCDEIWFIDAPDAVRLERAKSRGWSEAEFRAREATQWPLDLKRAHATKIMSNFGPLAQLDQQLAAAWRSLVGESAEDGSSGSGSARPRD
ncbi:MAG TPA: dephospho-CoA kinase [Pirellulales bacterium]